MYRVLRTIGCVLFLFAFSPFHTKAQQSTVSKLDAYLDQAKQAGVFNGNILVADHGRTILRRALGYADASRKVPLSLSDRFAIGSVAKEFDAVGLLMLAEQGQLSLTDPLSHFFPDLPSWAATVTIDDLLHYTSGLPELDWNRINSDADAWRFVHALMNLDQPAGTHYAYNNDNVFLRKRVIEKVSGMSFAKFLETQEFPRAGLRAAVIDPTEATPRVAKGFDDHGKQDSLAVPVTGWAWLTLDDFFRWSQCITEFCLIGPNSTRQIVTTRNPQWQTGLGSGEMVGDRLVSHVHDGSQWNYQALLMTYSDTGRSLIILTNQRHDNVYAMSDAISAILDGKPYAPLRTAKK